MIANTKFHLKERRDNKLKPNVFDIAIIGLGPAGSTLARLLSPNFLCIALDQKEETGDIGFHKPCGGLLAPDAQKMMAEMGLNLEKEILVDPQIFSVRTVDLDSGSTRYYQRNYVNMDRHKFDLWLKSLIPTNIEVHHHTYCDNIKKVRDGFAITYLENSIKTTVLAKKIVGADGAKSMVRHFLYPHAKPSSYLSIQQWFKEENANPFYSCVFDSENTDCYSWSISKDGYFIFGGAYPLDHARKRFENQKTKLMNFGFIMGEPLKTEACLVLRPRSANDFFTGHHNGYLIGEAAGFISPSSLEGISYAFASGKLLAETLNENENNKEYNQKIISIKRKLYQKCIKAPFLYQPLLRKIIMKSGIDSIPVNKKPSKT